MAIPLFSFSNFYTGCTAHRTSVALSFAQFVKHDYSEALTAILHGYHLPTPQC
jgi:hypothetical protein